MQDIGEAIRTHAETLMQYARCGDAKIANECSAKCATCQYHVDEYGLKSAAVFAAAWMKNEMDKIGGRDHE